jgi:hypothetical protein
MVVDATRLRQNLREFDFTNLFIEELGWDRLRVRPHEIPVDGTAYTLTPVAEKRGFQVFTCSPGPEGEIPDRPTRMRIERELTRLAFEHLIVFVDAGRAMQRWLWVRREPGKPLAPREETFVAGQAGERLVQKLRGLAIDFEEEERLSIAEVAGRARRAFDVDRVTRRFYDRFKTEHAAFLRFVEGIRTQGDREWYASLMLNRLMFVYFIQKKGFLDGDPEYLRNRLTAFCPRVEPRAILVA